MTVPNVLNLKFYSGDDDELKFVIKDSNGAVVDLTGATARFQVRVATNSALPLLDIAGVIDGPAGEITFPITPANTAALTPDDTGPIQYVHDIELIKANSDVQTLFRGGLTAFADVTRGA